MQYELCYLIGESKESQLKAIGEKVRKAISEEGGRWLEPEIAQKRKMAYKVQSEIRGIYIAQRFEVPDIENENGADKKDFIALVTRKLNLDNDVLRFIIVKADELPELKAQDMSVPAKIMPAKKFAKLSAPAKKEKKKEVEKESIDKKLEEILNI